MYIFIVKAAKLEKIKLCYMVVFNWVSNFTSKTLVSVIFFFTMNLITRTNYQMIEFLNVSSYNLYTSSDTHKTINTLHTVKICRKDILLTG